MCHYFSSHRNVMMRLNLQLTMGSFSLTLFGLIGVAFGMNLESSFEEVKPTFCKKIISHLEFDRFLQLPTTNASSVFTNVYLRYVYTSLPVYVFAPGPSGFLAGNRLHVLGQRTDMETAAVISGATSGAFSAPISNTNTQTIIMASQHFLFFISA